MNFRRFAACFLNGRIWRVGLCAGALLVPDASAVPIRIDYSGVNWTEEAKAAGNAAADVWSKFTGQKSYATEEVVILAQWQDVPGVSGTESGVIRNFIVGDPDPLLPYSEGVWYPTSLASHLARKDLTATVPDMTITFSTRRSFHYELDHIQDGLKYDFYTTMLHEIGHGLGFLSLLLENGDYEPIGGLPQHMPSVYDRSLLVPSPDGGYVPIFTLEMEDRAQAVISGAVYWSGDFGELLGTPDQKPKIYAPTDFELVSSLSHLDPEVYPGALMVPIYTGPRLAPQKKEIGMLLDMGWLYPARSLREAGLADLPEPGTLTLLLLPLFALFRLDRKQSGAQCA